MSDSVWQQIVHLAHYVLVFNSKTIKLWFLCLKFECFYVVFTFSDLHAWVKLSRLFQSQTVHLHGHTMVGQLELASFT